VIADVVAAGAEKLKFLSNRGLRDRKYSPAPLSIHFKRRVFDDLGEVRRFVDVMRKYPHSAYAIEHGNPYAHLQLSDRYDGSSFELWAVTSDDILVVPRLRATEAALERLIHYIYDEFREGEVVAQKSEAYRVVAEVKRSLPSDRTKWRSHVAQVRKYDDDLIGWWTDDNRIGEADTALLLHQSRSRAFIAVLRGGACKRCEGRRSANLGHRVQSVR
jgi:hypothetical protein